MNQLLTEVKVGLDFGDGAQPVGRLAIRNHVIYFEYYDQFIQQGIEISPRHLPLKRGLTELPSRPFEGLPGVFNDSLPDGWGRLLFDRMIRSGGGLLSDISPLDRLAHVGLSGMGALVYEPDRSPAGADELINLDQLATDAEEILEGSSEEVIEALLALNGSSAGARPKALIGVDSTRTKISYGVKMLDEDFEPWLVKFPNSPDGAESGAVEYIYAVMAKEAGISMPETYLFSSQKGKGYFAVKRFDREGSRRLHMHTASGLLHSDFRMPSLDYEDLLILTGALTKDQREVEKLFRLAVFNVLAHNRDDHAKNFSFLMNKAGEWKLSPAYDLTFSSGPGGEQSTMVAGEGRNPDINHLVKLGTQANISKKLVDNIIGQTRQALNRWEYWAQEYQVSDTVMQLIARNIKR